MIFRVSDLRTYQTRSQELAVDQTAQALSPILSVCCAPFLERPLFSATSEALHVLGVPLGPLRVLAVTRMTVLQHEVTGKIPIRHNFLHRRRTYVLE
jgi:hypothetical protein